MLIVTGKPRSLPLPVLSRQRDQLKRQREWIGRKNAINEADDAQRSQNPNKNN